MMRLSVLLISLAVSVTLSGCNTFQTSDFPIMVRLPASRECEELKVMSGKKQRYPIDQCDHMIERAIILTSSAWKMIKTDIQTNCQNAQCTQIQGAADSLFLAIDQALQKVPLQSLQ